MCARVGRCARVGFVLRSLGVLLGLPLLLAGAVGLVLQLAGEGTLALRAEDGLFALERILVDLGAPLPRNAAADAREQLAGLAGLVLGPAGLGVLLTALLAFRGGRVPKEAASGVDAVTGLPTLDKKQIRKVEKQAAVLRKKGQLVEAAEMLLGHERQDAAADLFIEAGEWVRAAEIRHDQNRFQESAELHLKAENFGAAGAIFSQLEEWKQAGECYLKIDSTGTAAEMFEKAEDHARAADCYREVGFLREAARSYVKCRRWKDAAACLEEVYRDEVSKGGQTDPRRLAELEKLVRQTGTLYRKAGDLEAAKSVLQKGGCPLEAAEIALELEHYGDAAELFRDASELPRAADALRSLGEDAAAARLMGEYHRDRGELREAAGCLEAAEDLLEAGDLYRTLEEYERAGQCYVSQGDYPQAAEMFKLGGDRKRAADAYERAGAFDDAAECYALAGEAEKEAELLERAGRYLQAGEAFHREGLDEAAITALQKVDPGSDDAAGASALLGDIFRARGQLSLAIKKLSQAVEDREIDRQTVGVFYTLATIHEENEEIREAVELYEKILAFDYHHQDVDQRLARARERMPADPEPEASQGAVQGGQPGRYQVVGELGRGGMGIVYEAHDTVLDRTVAYKVLPESFQENPQALDNFLREAKAAAKLNHPNIVTVYDAGEQDGRYYIAMEYVDGTTLKEILRRRGPVAPAGVLHVLVQVCEALAFAHEKKVVHRDIKSANTMWTRDKKVKIMDFGLAKVVEEVRNHTTVVSGTPYYMSPEQTLGKNVDHRTDIYSLGVMVFELATGSVPFKEGNIPYHHVHTAPPDIRELKPELPEMLARIVARCLQKDPAQRYQTTNELLAELRGRQGA